MPTTTLPRKSATPLVPPSSALAVASLSFRSGPPPHGVTATRRLQQKTARSPQAEIRPPHRRSLREPPPVQWPPPTDERGWRRKTGENLEDTTGGRRHTWRKTAEPSRGRSRSGGPRFRRGRRRGAPPAPQRRRGRPRRRQAAHADEPRKDGIPHQIRPGEHRIYPRRRRNWPPEKHQRRRRRGQPGRRRGGGGRGDRRRKERAPRRRLPCTGAGLPATCSGGGEVVEAGGWLASGAARGLRPCRPGRSDASGRID